LDANVLRQGGDSLKFRHPLLREATYDDLMPDERTRIHGRLAEILQARVDTDPDPGAAALSRLAFHWNAAHDLPRTLAASVRAGLAAKRLAVAEALTQLERALSLWDRVPDAEAVAGHPQAELVLLLGEAATEQGDDERGYTLVSKAVDMLGPDPDRLLASRVYSALGIADAPEAMVGRQEAIRRAVEYAGVSPSEELARALIAQSQYLYRHNHFTYSLEAAQRAIDAARIAGCVEAELDALWWECLSRAFLGYTGEALAGQERAVAVARSAGMVGHVVVATGRLATRYMAAGQVDRGLAVANGGFEEGLTLGLPVQAALCGSAVVMAHVWRGRFNEAEQRLAELGELSEARWSFERADLLLARGDADAASPLIRENVDADGGSPGAADVLAQIRLAEMLDDHPGALETARSYLAQMEDTDSPLRAAAVARIGFHALCLGRSTPGAGTDDLRDLSARQLASARGGLTAEWRPTYHGVQLALAEAYAARYRGAPAVAQFREATDLADPFGAYFALEPRLNLAEELLAHGGRDEGRELLVECWSNAHDMGARELERRALRLAARTRVPLPQSATREGPLSRLTPREREVLDLLATGATNKTIATTLFVTEKTASVHVSRVLAKLGAANRGEAAALARQLVG
jgi:DNA-binding CsgD family transcriptional regulator